MNNLISPCGDGSGNDLVGESQEAGQELESRPIPDIKVEGLKAWVNNNVDEITGQEHRARQKVQGPCSMASDHSDHGNGASKGREHSQRAWMLHPKQGKGLERVCFPTSTSFPHSGYYQCQYRVTTGTQVLLMENKWRPGWAVRREKPLLLKMLSDSSKKEAQRGTVLAFFP